MSAASMEFVRLAQAPSDEEWAQILVRHHASALHHPAIHRADNSPDSIQYLTLRCGGEEVGCALVIEERQRRLRLPFGGGASLVLPSAPAIDVGVDRGEARRALLNYFDGARRLVVQPASSDWLVGDDDLAPYRQGAVVEFMMSLEGDLDTVRSTFHKVHRKNARRAVNKGVEIVEDSSAAGLLCLRDMQLASADRASGRDNPYAVRDENYFRQVQREVYSTGLGHVFFAQLDGSPIAALAWVQLGNRAQTVRSGSKEAGYQNYAMYALYDAVVERLIADGVHELNAGGVPAEASEKGHTQNGLYEFKKGYGGTPRLRYGLEISLQKDRPR